MTPGHYHLELHRVGAGDAACDQLALAAPLTSAGQIDTEEDLPFRAFWDGYAYSGELVLTASGNDRVNELHWDSVAVHYEPYLIDLLTVPVVLGQIVTVWEGNLRSCPRRQFRLHRLDLVTPPRRHP